MGRIDARNLDHLDMLLWFMVFIGLNKKIENEWITADADYLRKRYKLRESSDGIGSTRYESDEL